MTLLERRLLTIALLLGVLTAGVVIRGGLGSGVAQAASGSYFGANESWVSAAASDWPQANGNWCGVANIELIANYTYEQAMGTTYFPFHSGGQQRIANALNSAAAVSQWGTPSWNGLGPGFRADIARDGGTDPRSIAWGILYNSAAGNYLHIHKPGYLQPKWATRAYSFHNVIYPSNFGIQYSVASMARTLERFQIPISVTMAHGLHSDVLSGVYATNDPVSAYPSNVTALTLWDPAVGTSTGGYQSAREVTWSYSGFVTSPSMWGTTYNANNGYDPDPSVGIYTPNASYPHHWITNWTDIEPDRRTDVSPDYAMDQNVNPMNHP